MIKRIAKGLIRLIRESQNLFHIFFNRAYFWSMGINF